MSGFVEETKITRKSNIASQTAERRSGKQKMSNLTDCD